MTRIDAFKCDRCDTEVIGKPAAGIWYDTHERIGPVFLRILKVSQEGFAVKESPELCDECIRRVIADSLKWGDYVPEGGLPKVSQ